MTPATIAPTKMRYPRLLALSVAQEIIDHLAPACSRIIVAGSLRREKLMVGDIEILYIPLMATVPSVTDFFQTVEVNRVDTRIEVLEAAHVLARRHNSRGSEMFGCLNKLMVHTATGIPVDLFATTEEGWFNSLVCRTGPADLNQRIAMAAIRKSWRWNVYGRGFTRGALTEPMLSEEAVFEFVGLAYREPRDRT